MIEKFLRMLALIDAYQYFESKNITLTDDNIGLFSFVVNDDYSFRIRKFIKDLLKQFYSFFRQLKNKNVSTTTTTTTTTTIF